MQRASEWFARNPVAANLLMAFIVGGGLIGMDRVRGETFPDVALDTLTIEMPYLGAAPEEVEAAVCIRIEEAVQGIEGIEEIVSTAYEGLCIVVVEVALHADSRSVLDDVKTRVDAIETFPARAEEPIISEARTQIRVVDIAVSGRADELALRRVAERVRDDLLSLPEITQVQFASVRPYEISIEVSESALRRHGLTFDDVARAVRRSSIDLPGGWVRSEDGEIRLRTVGQAYRGTGFENLVLLARADGTRLHVGDVATVVDGFAETDQFGRLDGEPAVLLSVFRTGGQSDMEISRAVNDYLERKVPTLPEGIRLTKWMNQADALVDRLGLMLRNGIAGLALVFALLAVFLELRLAFWVCLGIPISFLGTFMLMPGLDVTANIVSTFAFIMVLGIVVDDAIIVGENVYRHQRRGRAPLEGAIRGVQEVATPVLFAVLTTVAAFAPLLFVPGLLGEMMRYVPLVVIPCVLFSLVESLNILPAHLATRSDWQGRWSRFQRVLADGLETVADRVYRPALAASLRWRYLTLAAGASVLVLTVGLVLGGRVAFHFFPAPEADVVYATLTMPPGTPAAVTAAVAQRLEDSAERLRREVIEQAGSDPLRHVLTAIGNQPLGTAPGPLWSRPNETSGHLVQVMLELAPAGERDVRADPLGRRWRELTGPIPEAVELGFSASDLLPGEEVDVQLVGADPVQLRAAVEHVKNGLRGFAGVHDVSDSFEGGPREMRIGIKPAAEALGLALEDVGRQVRQAFYGEEAQRIQRGRDDIRVMVRYPADARRSLGDLENMRIRTPDADEIPFGYVAAVETGRGVSTIRRVNRNRAINVTAALDETVTSAGAVYAALAADVMPAVEREHAGVRYSFEGSQADQDAVVGSLQVGFPLALFAIFALLAIPLGSYVQPLIIMSAIPLGFVGAVAGHIVMNEDVTMLSMMGIVALSGVVVNDSLVMVDFINRERRGGRSLLAAVQAAGVARLRPILLTSITTFTGLAPLLMEEGAQADFLKPMAISLAFGVLFATAVTLVLVPAAYLILEDLERLLRLPFRGRDAAR